MCSRDDDTSMIDKHYHFQPSDSTWVCPETDCDYVWVPAIEDEPAYESFGPVVNEDGTPTEFTKRMFGVDDEKPVYTGFEGE